MAVPAPILPIVVTAIRRQPTPMRQRDRARKMNAHQGQYKQQSHSVGLEQRKPSLHRPLSNPKQISRSAQRDWHSSQQAQHPCFDKKMSVTPIHMPVAIATTAQSLHES